MRCKALISFSGINVNMAMDEVRDLDKSIAKELIESGLVVEMKPDKKPKKKGGKKK
jgi:hypothetical protein